MHNSRLKFRVWCPILKSWNNSDQLCLRSSGLVTDGSVSIDKKYLQFCTGLKDSKNKLIFEGDVVKFRREDYAVCYCEERRAFVLVGPGSIHYLENTKTRIVGHSFEGH